MRKLLTCGVSILLSTILLVSPLLCLAQQGDIPKQLITYKKQQDSLLKADPPEKIFIQFDKPYYAQGDTVWFKAYLFNAPTHLLSAKSGLMHADIADDSGRVVKQYLFKVYNGISWGNIALNGKDFKAGNYVFRAYTNWMRNFGSDHFFYKNIRVAGTNESGWLVTQKVSSSLANDQEHIHAMLQFTDMNKSALTDSLLRIQVMQGNKTLYRQKIKTDDRGIMDISFGLKRKASQVTLIAENEARTKKAAIPLTINPPGDTDLQFLPEGGEMVAGFTAHIGFKAVGEDGKGVPVAGIITDQDQKQVATFRSFYNGIGSFDLFAENGKKYTAKLALPGGAVKEYPLPATDVSGTMLRLKNFADKDSLEVTLAASDDIARSGDSYFLLGQARGIICYAAIVDFNKGHIIHSRISKRLFPTGIVHFMLETTQDRPLNERLVYIGHNDDLHIRIEPGQEVYAPKDSVALHLKVTDHLGRPVAGNFSLSVTDDAQVKTDSLDGDDILSRMLLTSDVKNYVEHAGYYLLDSDSSRQAVDNLLLTQGWVRYEPLNAAMPYGPETGFTVKGRVNNVLGKPLKKQDIVLFSKSPSILMDTLTNKEGRFAFGHFPRVDTPIFFLKTNKRNFNVNIDVDEYTPPKFEVPDMPVPVPWYVNTDSTLMNYVKSDVIQKDVFENIPPGGHTLKEVVVKASKIVTGSQNLNGPGNADIVLDEKDLEKAGKKSLLDLFRENIPGFREVRYWTGTYYFSNRRYIILIVNGTMIARVFTKFDMRQYLEFHNAEDIKGMEINTSSKYEFAYMRRYFPSEMIDPTQFAFVEITTRSGDLKMENTPGTYLYKPLAISWPKQFYKPKYKINDTTKTQDLRSTIDWEPNINTDAEGNAVVSLYAGSKPSTYSVVMEGTDLNGSLGYERRRIVIKPAEKEKSK
ncbi:MAG TPA: hypothetical protein VHC47_01810 [Mucilaginibacter sp.]|nr:hypothetical protein [Mucilaginibacter sp.]